MSYAAPAQVLMYLALAPAAYAVPIVTATGGFASLPVVLIVFTCSCGGVHYVCTSSVRCTCTCRGVHRASTSGVRNTCGGVLCANTINVRCTCICLVYIAPAPAVYETPVVVYIALAPAVYAAPVPVIKYITSAQAVLRRA